MCVRGDMRESSAQAEIAPVRGGAVLHDARAVEHVREYQSDKVHTATLPELMAISSVNNSKTHLSPMRTIGRLLIFASA